MGVAEALGDRLGEGLEQDRPEIAVVDLRHRTREDLVGFHPVTPYPSPVRDRGSSFSAR